MDINDFIQNSFTGEIDFDIIRLLLFLLILVLVYLGINKSKIFKDAKPIEIIISLSIALLSTWYLTKSQFFAAILPYRFLGTFLIWGIPYIIIFLVLHKSEIHGGARKIVWGAVAVILATLWYQNNTNGIAVHVQAFTTLIGIAIAMIILDRPIHKTVSKRKHFYNN